MFNEYPYRNLTDLNLDYILNAIKTFQNEVTNFVSINAIKYANPIQWNITSQYEKNTIVIDPLTGTAYISVAPVPTGVALTREEYWTVVFDLGSFVVRAAKNFTDRYEADTTLTATFSTPAGGWIVWGDTLYRAAVNITAGDSYVVGSNIIHFTMETEAQDIRNIIGLLSDLNTTDKSSVVAAINEVFTTLTDTATRLADAIDDEAEARAQADEGLQENIDAEAEARAQADEGLQENIDAEATARANNIADILNDLTNNHEELPTFSKNYEEGELFTIANELYTITVPVNIGDSISIGANCKLTDIEQVINSIVSIDYKTIQNSSGALTHLMQVAKTYIDNNDDLTYGNYNTLFSTDCSQVGGKWVIDCSSFVEACLKGITFDNSRYNGNDSNIYGIGYDFQKEIVSAPDELPYRPYGMVSSAMYRYCEEHGYNYEIDNIDRIQLGDLIFLANNPNQYKSIGHVGFVINIRKASNAIVLLDASDDRSPVIQTTILSLDEGSTVKYGARFPLPYIAYQNNNLLNNGRNSVTSKTFNWLTGNTGANENLLLITNSPLEAKTVYSFVMVLDDPYPDNLELGIMALVNGQFTYLSGARFDTYAGGHILRGSFYTPPLFTSSFSENLYSIRLRALRVGSTASTRSETLNIKWYGLFEGLSNEPIENVLLPSSDDIITKSAPYETENVVNSLDDLSSAILNYATIGIDWSRQFHVIRVSANITLSDNTIIRSGRYIIDGLSYATGNYGGFIMRCVSGAHIIVSCAIANGSVSFAGIISTLP